MKYLRICLLFTLVTFFCNINARAQAFAAFLGESEDYIMNQFDKGLRKEMPNVQDGFANDGMPFKSYSSPDRMQRFTFYFSDKKFVMFRAIHPIEFSHQALTSLKESGFVYKDGVWIHEEGNISAIYTRLNSVFSIEYRRSNE